MENIEGIMEQKIMSDRLLRLEDVINKVSFRRSTIYKDMSEGKFPKNVFRGRTPLWIESEIDEYIQSLKAMRDNKQAK